MYVFVLVLVLRPRNHFVVEITLVMIYEIISSYAVMYTGANTL